MVIWARAGNMDTYWPYENTSLLAVLSVSISIDNEIRDCVRLCVCVMNHADHWERNRPRKVKRQNTCSPIGPRTNPGMGYMKNPAGGAYMPKNGINRRRFAPFPPH